MMKTTAAAAAKEAEEDAAEEDKDDETIRFDQTFVLIFNVTDKFSRKKV